MSDSYLPFRTDYNRWSDSSRDESPGGNRGGKPAGPPSQYALGTWDVKADEGLQSLWRRFMYA